MLTYFNKIDKKKLQVVDCHDFRVIDLWLKMDVDNIGMAT